MTAEAEAEEDMELDIVDVVVVVIVEGTVLDAVDDTKVDKVDEIIDDDVTVERKVVLQVVTEQLQLEPLKHVFTFEARHTVHDLVHSIPP